MLAAVLTGHVRRVVFDAAGVGATNAPGAAKPTTPNPGRATDRPAPTTVAACARHNRWKQQRGFRTQRDPTGRWHTYRPDGSEIGPLANAADTASEIRQLEFSSG